MSTVYVCMNMPGRAKRMGKTTSKQYEMMVDFMSQHIEMVNGKLSATFSVEKKQLLWKELAEILNQAAVPGPKKEAWKWRKTWTDIKSDVKRKARAIKRQQSKSDEYLDHQVEKLSSLEERILKMMEIASKESNKILHDYKNFCESISSSSMEVMQNTKEIASTGEKIEVNVEPSIQNGDYYIRIPCSSCTAPSTQIDGYFSELPCSTTEANIGENHCISQRQEQSCTSSTPMSMVTDSPSCLESDIITDETEKHETKNMDKNSSSDISSMLSQTNKLLERLVVITEQRNRIEQKRNEILFTLIEKVFQ